MGSSSDENTVAIATEAELVRQIRQDDRAALNLLFGHYGKRIDFVVRSKINNDDWEDVAWVIKEAVWKGIKESGFNAQKGTLNAWILGITRNQINKYFEKKYVRKKGQQNMQKRSMVDADPNLPPEIISDLEQEERVKAIKKTLPKLSLTHREVLRLRYFEDLSRGEIGERLAISKQKVSELENYARKRVRELLVY